MTAARRDRLRAVGALGAAVALVASVPLLWHFAGRPWPDRLPRADDVTGFVRQPLSDHALVVTVLAVAALWWSAFVASLVVEVVAFVRGFGRAPRLAALAVAQPLARRLAASVLTVVTLSNGPVFPVHATRVTVTASVPFDELAAVPATADAPVEQPARLRLYVVREPHGGHHDTLWAAAAQHLGDPLRYREIVALNVGRTMPDGRVFTPDHRLIRPGWTLLMPADATGLPLAPADRRSDAPPRRVARPRPTPPAQPSVTTPTPSAAAAPPDAVAPAPDDDETVVVRPIVELPSGSVVAASFLAGLASARAVALLRRRRTWQPSTRPAVRSADAPPPSPIDTAMHGAADASRVPNWLLAGRADTAPGVVPIAERDGQPVDVDLVALGGVTLHTPAPADTARAVVAAFLARSGPAGANALCAPAADALLLDNGTASLTEPADAVAALLDRADAEVLARHRLLDDADLPDFTAYRENGPDTPLAALLLVTGDVGDHAGRLAGILAAGQRVGVTALYLGPPGVTTTVVRADHDGIVRSAEPEQLAQNLAGARLLRLSAADAPEVFRFLAEAAEDTADRYTALGRAAADQEHDETAPPSADGPTTAACEHTTPSRHADAPPVPGAGTAALASSEEDHEEPPVRVTMLGPYVIEVAGRPVDTGLRDRARQLLAFHIINPRGATLERAVDVLWPADAARGADHHANSKSNLNNRVRALAGGDAGDVIEQVGGGLYRVNRAVVSCDLWGFQAALADAAAVGDGATKVDALARAADLYRGDLMESAAYHWVITEREVVREQVLNALTELAALHHRAGDLDAVAGAFERAVQIDPHAEELARRLMAIHAERGDAAGTGRAFRRLERALAELDVAPAPATVRLYERLSGMHARPT